MCISSEHPNYTRKTVSITAEIHRWIQKFRAFSLQSEPSAEYDYTSVVNYLMAYGIIFLRNHPSTSEDTQQANELLGSMDLLEQQGVLDILESLNKESAQLMHKGNKGPA